MSSAPSSREKTMSSRLLTMKFMQRAAATAAANTNSHPRSSTDNLALPSPKRQKIATDKPTSTPATPASSDLEAISVALAAEEAKRREALSRQTAESGETEWVLEFPGAPEMLAPFTQQLPFAVAGASLDLGSEGLEYGGRVAFGNFKRKNKNVNGGNANYVDAMIKEERDHASKSAPTKVKLSKLTSISGGRHGDLSKPTGTSGARHASNGDVNPKKKRKSDTT